MKTGKRLTALFLALALLLTVAAPGWITTAHAATTDLGKLSMTYINPLYEDVVTEADLKKPGHPVLYADNRDNEYIYSPEAAGDLIRDDLVNRDETIIVDVFVPYTGDAQSDFENACHETLAWAMIHTGCGVEGDYLQWQYGGWSAGVEDYYLSDDNYLCMSIVFTMTYYTTAAQEAVVTEKVNEVIASLDLTYADAYTKLKAIYDYICANVTYDYENLNDTSYKLKHSAYAALIDGTAVCQGYALLMYRMALDLGIDCRLIAGDGGGPHGWNIAEIDGLYYNLDSTWDAGRSVYNYFLVCPDNFTDHVRYEEYDTPEFHEYYPMASENYVPTCAHSYTAEVTVEATCTEDGVITYTCDKCGDFYTEVEPATEHMYVENGIAEEPSCISSGLLRYTCIYCGDSWYESIGFGDHQFDGSTCTFCGTGLYAPTITSCYSIEQTSVKVTWTGQDAADGYELWRTTTPDDEDSWMLAKTITDGKTNRYTNQGLEKGVTYYYRVRSYVVDINGVTIFSEFSEADYMPAAVVFDGPYSNATYRIRLRWNEIQGAHGYQIWGQNADGSWRIVKTIGDKGTVLTQDMGSTTAYSNTGLTAGDTYTYKMRAFRITEDGRRVFGAYSDEITVAVMPDAPVITGSSTKATRAQISWEAVNGAAGYQIWMADASGEYKIVKSLTDGTITSYTKYDLTSGETYTFKVRAYTEVDGKKTFGAYSNELAITVK